MGACLKVNDGDFVCVTTHRTPAWLLRETAWRCRTSIEVRAEHLPYRASVHAGVNTTLADHRRWRGRRLTLARQT